MPNLALLPLREPLSSPIWTCEKNIGMKKLPKFPTLRSDLEIIARPGPGQPDRHIIKVPRSEEIFEFGKEEFFLCLQLDGRTDLSTVQARFDKRFHVALTLDQLEMFVRQIEAQGLLFSETSTPAAPEYSAVIKRRLFDPDRLFNCLAPCFNWCFSTVFAIGACLVLMLALGIAFNYWADFVNELRLMWDQDFFLRRILFRILIIHLLGEIAKGIACKHCGGHVREFGVKFLYRIIPRFYCDVSDSLSLKKKSDRILILSTGLGCHLLLLAMSIIAWKTTASWTSAHVFWLVFTGASCFCLFLNWNPLFQADGYYLLSAWLKIPDLRKRAISLTRAWILRKPQSEPLTSREILGFKLYGLLVLGFNVIFWPLLLGLVGYLLIWSMKGIGACLFAVLLGLRFEHVLKRQYRRILSFGGILTNEVGAPIRPRRLVQVGLPIIIILCMFIPYPFTVGGQFRLLPANQLGIRVQVPGEIKSVLVRENQLVKKDQPVAILLGRDQRKKVETVTAALDEAQARLDLLREGPKREEIAKAEQEVKTAAKSLEYSMLQSQRSKKMFREKAISEKEQEDALRDLDMDKERLKLAEKNLKLVKSGARDEQIKAFEAEIRRLKVELAHAKEDLQLTTLLSPADGRIITPYLSQKVGQFLGVGDLLAVIEDAQTIIAEIEVPEENVGEVSIGARVKLKTWALPNTTFIGHVMAIAPVAYEKTKGRVERSLSERELLLAQSETRKKEGMVIRVLSELDNSDGLLKTEMTGYAKIECERKPLGIVYTRWLARLLFVEVWSWIP